MISDIENLGVKPLFTSFSAIKEMHHSAKRKGKLVNIGKVQTQPNEEKYKGAVGKLTG